MKDFSEFIGCMEAANKYIKELEAENNDKKDTLFQAREAKWKYIRAELRKLNEMITECGIDLYDFQICTTMYGIDSKYPRYVGLHFTDEEVTLGEYYVGSGTVDRRVNLLYNYGPKSTYRAWLDAVIDKWNDHIEEYIQKKVMEQIVNETSARFELLKDKSQELDSQLNQYKEEK